MEAYKAHSGYPFICETKV